MLQVRNLPDETHEILKRRARAEGMSLSDYVKRMLVREAGQSTLLEIRESVHGRGPKFGWNDVQGVVDLIREDRDR